jgi:hypothetical protein
MKMEETKYSEMFEHKIQTAGNHPNERMQLSEHGEILKSRSGQILVSADSPPRNEKSSNQ